MINNKVILKTTAEGSEVLTSEILNISVDFNNKSVSINEKETVVDLSGTAMAMPNKYSHYGYAEAPINGAVAQGQLSALSEADRVRNEQLAQDIFDLIAAYRIEIYNENQTQTA